MAIEDFYRANAPVDVPAETRKFDEFIQAANNNDLQSFTFDKRHTPEVDIYEDPDLYEVDVALPGMNREDIDVNVRGSEIRISGEKTILNPQSRREYHTVENNYGRFDRSFELPGDADTSAISADYGAGLLRVTIPRQDSDADKELRRIDIQ